jgi:hypothetical protein
MQGTDEDADVVRWSRETRFVFGGALSAWTGTNKTPSFLFSPSCRRSTLSSSSSCPSTITHKAALRNQIRPSLSLNPAVPFGSSRGSHRLDPLRAHAGGRCSREPGEARSSRRARQRKRASDASDWSAEELGARGGPIGRRRPHLREPGCWGIPIDEFEREQSLVRHGKHAAGRSDKGSCVPVNDLNDLRMKRKGLISIIVVVFIRLELVSSPQTPPTADGRFSLCHEIRSRAIESVGRERRPRTVDIRQRRVMWRIDSSDWAAVNVEGQRGSERRQCSSRVRHRLRSRVIHAEKLHSTQPCVANQLARTRAHSSLSLKLARASPAIQARKH